MNQPITITAANISDVEFRPGNAARSKYPSANKPVEITLWDPSDSVTVATTADAVVVTQTTTTVINPWTTTEATTVTTYRCPVRIVSCVPDFSMFADDGPGWYVPSPGIPDFGMFSDDGNLAVECAVFAAIDADNLTTVKAVQDAVEGHPEVGDTVVRENIHAALKTAGLLREEGWA